MLNNEKKTEAIIEALIEQIRSLKSELWWRDQKIVELSEKLEKAKGGANDG